VISPGLRRYRGTPPFLRLPSSQSWVIFICRLSLNPLVHCPVRRLITDPADLFARQQVSYPRPRRITESVGLFLRPLVPYPTRRCIAQLEGALPNSTTHRQVCRSGARSVGRPPVPYQIRQRITQSDSAWPSRPVRHPLPRSADVAEFLTGPQSSAGRPCHLAGGAIGPCNIRADVDRVLD